jgi:hypothetical protein
MAQRTLRTRRSGSDTVSRNAGAGLKQREAYLYALFDYSPFTTVVVNREARIVTYNAAKKNSGDRLPRDGEIMYRDYAAKHSIDMYAELMECIAGAKVKNFPELRYNDKILAVTLAPFPDGAIIVSQDVTEAKRAEEEMVALIDQLHRALQEIKTLRELLPICACCKRIRDDSGYWNGVEEYFSRRSKVNFSHTLCPECVRKLYPDMHFGEQRNTTPPGPVS